MKSSLFLEIFLIGFLVSYLRNCCLVQGHRFIPVFSSKGFMVLALFRSLILSGFLFAYGVRYGLISVFWHVSIQESWYPFVKETFFSLNYLGVVSVSECQTVESRRIPHLLSLAARCSLNIHRCCVHRGSFSLLLWAPAAPVLPSVHWVVTVEGSKEDTVNILVSFREA